MEFFRTVLANRDWDFKINYPSSHFLIGSCFSENIGKHLEKAKFDSILNPFGILFHPEPILRVLERLLENKAYTSSDLHFIDKRYVSFDHHGSYNNTSREKVLNTINSDFNNAQKQLVNADYLYITWGTAFAYSYIESNQIVSNCHKIPSSKFNKIRSTSGEIVNKYKLLFTQLIKQNPKLKIILSVSPVKHLKDGLLENNLSKAVLLLAADQLVKECASVSYFPSYELLTDDLRDYRFYTKDMAHPNELAIEYIWKYFIENLLSKDADKLYKEIKSINQSIAHRPLHPENEAHASFIARTIDKIELIEKKYPFINFKKEKIDLRSRIITN